jgi:hypothetical protein
MCDREGLSLGIFSNSLIFCLTLVPVPGLIEVSLLLAQGKPLERVGRKATGLSLFGIRQQGCQAKAVYRCVAVLA